VTAGEFTHRLRRPHSLAVPRPRLHLRALTRRQAGAPLALRLVAIFGLLVATTVLLVAGATALVARAQLARNLDAQLRGTAESFRLGPATHAAGGADLAGATRRWLAEHPLPVGQMAAIRIGHNRVYTSAGNLDMFEVPSPRTLLTATSPTWWTLRSSEGSVRSLTVPIRAQNRQAGTLVLLAYRRPLDQTLQALLNAITSTSLAGLAAALLLGGLIVARSLRPLRTMTAEVATIETTRDLARRVNLGDAPGEVGELATAFDRMLSRLEQAFESQRRFLADASHELRTPLTVVRGQLELLADQLDGRPNSLLQQSEQELDRMARIVDDLLLLARLEEGMPLRSEPVELELLVREALLRAMLIAPRASRAEAEAGLYARADGERLLQVLTNLVANAIKHTDENDAIVLTAARANGHALLQVSDTGHGIAPSELSHVFDRFYRGAQRRAIDPDGSGLGLSIARSLVESMDGTIDVDSTLGHGTTFTVRLPLWRAADSCGSPRNRPRDAASTHTIF
jgi:two-component system, OmpR family, sensor kinase